MSTAAFSRCQQLRLVIADGINDLNQASTTVHVGTPAVSRVDPDEAAH